MTSLDLARGSPRTTTLRQSNTHRLIPVHANDQSVLRRLAEDDDQLEQLFELDGATNDRLIGEANLLPGISVHELLFGIPYAHIVNAAFCHAHPFGSRFNGPDRGAWYSTTDLATARAEITFHKRKELQEINWREAEAFVLDDYLADFRAEFHDIRGDPAFADCLDPLSYEASQQLARTVLAEGSAGIVYPSVRRPHGTCLVCFRPALVMNVRKGETVTVKIN